MDEMNERMKELEAEMSDLRISIWARGVAAGKPESATKPASVSSYTMMEAPVSDHGNTVISLSDQPIEQDQHESATTKDDGPESTVTLGRTAQLENSEIAQPSVSLAPSNNNSRDSKTNILSNSDDRTEVPESQDNSIVNDPTSPFNTTNPHPTLCININVNGNAIRHWDTPGSRFERSILHRERIDTPEVADPDSVLNGVYTDWSWIPFIVSGAAADLVPTNICEGDIELICPKNDLFVALIEDTMKRNTVKMFDYASTPTEPSYLHYKFAPGFSEPEAYGLRVLAWKVHGPEGCYYMSRAGHRICDVL
ncbi:Ff.00g016650.m01.CDS01 [Fusarium sp. VM40]|nr:Ff.00g016650.m01.CDS01 [Fusarium sp. VM40]